MNSELRNQIILIVVVILIVTAIYLLEDKTNYSADVEVKEIAQENTNPKQSKKGKYNSAKEIVNPSGFINSNPFKLADLIGDQVILLDIWTYSCINCQRTLPYITAWDEKYRDQGLTIVGIHSPEFEFEKDLTNVEEAVEKFNIEYPVVLDNDFGTWRAYGNRYWPRKYLIDIDGFIAYDHIGEGAYDETEEKIQELLAERNERLGLEATIEEGIVEVDAIERSANVGSPEVYFGALRNEFLSNGTPGKAGEGSYTEPVEINLNELILRGDWNITEEYASNTSANAGITFKYLAKNVFLVAASEEPVQVQVFQDDVLVKEITVQNEQLYRLIEDENVGEHVLKLKIIDPGFQAFAFTFG